MDRRRSRSAAGVTLLEVLVVIVIFSMILGLTIGLLRNSNRDLGVMAATNAVAGFLRAAEEHARAENSPAWVLIDMDQRTAGTLIRENLLMCHFEDTSAGFNNTIQVQGPIQVLGRVGLAYRFSGANIIDCGDLPRLSPDQGIAIEMWFNRAPGTTKHVLATLGKDMELMVDAVGRIQARVGTVTATSGTNLVPREWWVYVQAIYNGREIKIIINGVEAGSAVCHHTWSPGSSRLILGAKKDGLAGLMDEVRVSGIVASDPYMLPPQVEFELPRNAKLQGNEFLIAFDATGKLDSARHPGDLTLIIKSPATSKTIVVTRQGMIRR